MNKADGVGINNYFRDHIIFKKQKNNYRQQIDSSIVRFEYFWLSRS